MSDAGGENEAETDAAAPPPAKKSWIRAANDKLPTKWIASIGTVLFLIATAAFGGLQAVAETPPPEIERDEIFVGTSMEFTPTALYLTNETQGLGIRLEEGEELLVLAVQVTNTDDSPRLAISKGSASETRIEGGPDAAPELYRLDDRTQNPWLQPRVTAPLMLVWRVSIGEFAMNDEVRLVLPESTKYQGSFVQAGTYWDDVRTGAVATLPIMYRVHIEEDE